MPHMKVSAMIHGVPLLVVLFGGLFGGGGAAATSAQFGFNAQHTRQVGSTCGPNGSPSSMSVVVNATVPSALYVDPDVTGEMEMVVAVTNNGSFMLAGNQAWAVSWAAPGVATLVSAWSFTGDNYADACVFNASVLLMAGSNATVLDLHTGAIVWTNMLPSTSGGSSRQSFAPVVDPAGTTAYVSLSYGPLLAISLRDGSLLWSTVSTSVPGSSNAITCRAAAALSLDGAVVYAATVGDGLVALHAGNGSVLWNVTLCSKGYTTPVDTAPVVSPRSGTLFVASTYCSSLMAITAEGRTLWQRQLSEYAYIGSVSLALDSRSSTAMERLAVVDGADVYMLDALAGTMQWSLNGSTFGLYVLSYYGPSVSIDASGTVYTSFVPGTYAPLTSRLLLAVRGTDGMVLWNMSWPYGLLQSCVDVTSGADGGLWTFNHLGNTIAPSVQLLVQSSQTAPCVPSTLPSPSSHPAPLVGAALAPATIAGAVIGSLSAVGAALAGVVCWHRRRIHSDRLKHAQTLDMVVVSSPLHRSAN